MVLLVPFFPLILGIYTVFYSKCRCRANPSQEGNVLIGKGGYSPLGRG